MIYNFDCTLYFDECYYNTDAQKKFIVQGQVKLTNSMYLVKLNAI